MSITRMALPSLAAAAALFVGMTHAADAQNARNAQRCAPRADLLKQLSSLYREAPVAVGVADDGNLLEVLAANKGETWTVLVTRANGVSCVMITGQDWHAEVPSIVARAPSDDLTH
jgi:hypothetical protein